MEILILAFLAGPVGWIAVAPALGLIGGVYMVLGPRLWGPINLWLVRFSETSGLTRLRLGKWQKDLPYWERINDKWIIKKQFTRKWDVVCALVVMHADNKIATFKALYRVQVDLTNRNSIDTANYGNYLGTVEDNGEVRYLEPASTATTAFTLTDLLKILAALNFISSIIKNLADAFADRDPIAKENVVAANDIVKRGPQPSLKEMNYKTVQADANAQLVRTTDRAPPDPIERKLFWLIVFIILKRGVKQ